MASLLFLGCPSGPATSVVVGVTSDLHPGTDFNTFLAEISVNGAKRASKTFAATPTLFPLEVPVTDLEGGDTVDVHLSAFIGPATLVERRSETKAIAGKDLLLRVPLDRACTTNVAPMCGATETCAGGACVPIAVDPAHLSAYTPDWVNGSSTDPCKKSGDTPTVEVGSGQADYLPTMDGAVAQVEAGPQGGYHVWIAIRTRGLRQSSSITTVTGTFPSLGYDVAPFAVVFTFDPTDGGACKLYGLRFRLDDDAHPIMSLLGKQLQIKVSVSDTDGATGSGTRSVVLSNDIL